MEGGEVIVERRSDAHHVATAFSHGGFEEGDDVGGFVSELVGEVFVEGDEVCNVHVQHVLLDEDICP